MSSSSCVLLRMKSLSSPAFSSFCPRPAKALVGLPFSSSQSPFVGRGCANRGIGRRSCAAAAPDSDPSSFRSVRARGVQMTACRSHPGEVHVIVGPMFAGKTTALLRRIEVESSNGRSVAVVKSNKDTRYGLDSIVTHDGARLPCLALAELSSFKQKLGLDAYDKLDVIGIDEAQFFGDLYDFCREAADRDGKSVIVAGLDGDYMRRRFGSVLDIIPLADSVTKLSARCELCGKPAFFTLRKTGDTKTELIGGAEIYMPVCRQHYASGQVALETTRIVLESQSQTIRSG